MPPPKTHTNVLDHMMGYFSKELSAPERQELLGVIHDYRRQLIPLIVPITLVRHYTKKYDVGYLRRASLPRAQSQRVDAAQSCLN